MKITVKKIDLNYLTQKNENDGLMKCVSQFFKQFVGETSLEETGQH